MSQDARRTISCVLGRAVYRGATSKTFEYVGCFRGHRSAVAKNASGTIRYHRTFGASAIVRRLKCQPRIGRGSRMWAMFGASGLFAFAFAATSWVLREKGPARK